jgi:hypothetical protein
MMIAQYNQLTIGTVQNGSFVRHLLAAITHGRNDRSDDEGHRLAAALGARLSCRRRAQAPQAQARLEEGGRQPGLSFASHWRCGTFGPELQPTRLPSSRLQPDLRLTGVFWNFMLIERQFRR